MARKKHLINVHTSTGTTAPTGASLYLGEIAVQHTPNDPALWIKVGSAETSTVYEKFIGKTEITNIFNDSKILGSGYTYSGLSYVNSSTTIADAYSALTNELFKDEKVTAAALNELNDRVNTLSGVDIDSIISEYVAPLSGVVEENELVTASALNDLNNRMLTGVSVNGVSAQVVSNVAELDIPTPEMILGSGYTYSGLSYVNSATTIADAYSALTKEIIDDELVISAALNDINDRLEEVPSVTDVDELSASVVTNETNIQTLSGWIDDNEFVTAAALNDLNQQISAVTADIAEAEIVVAGALNDLNDRLDSLSSNTYYFIDEVQNEFEGQAGEMSALTESLVKLSAATVSLSADTTVNNLSGSLMTLSAMVRANSIVAAAALNDLNARINTLSGKDVDAIIETVSGSVDEAIESLSGWIIEDEYVISSSFNDLNSRLVELSAVTAVISGNSGGGGGGGDYSALSSATYSHVTNNNIHVTSAQKTAWTNGSNSGASAYTAVTALSAATTAHTGNGNIHVTSAQKTTWTNQGNSGASAYTAVTALSAATTAHTANTTVHITSDERTRWNSAWMSGVSAYTKVEQLSAVTIAVKDSLSAVNHNIPYVLQSGDIYTGTSARCEAVCNEIAELTEGQSIILHLKRGTATASTDGLTSAFGLNLTLSGGTETGWKTVYYGGTSKVTTHYVGGNDIRLTYHENLTVSATTGLTGWWVEGNYDSNSDVIAYAIRYNNTQRVTTSQMYRYRLMFSSADENYWVPANSATSTNATSVRSATTTPIDPFGPIAYYATTTVVSSGASPGGSAVYTQYSAVTLGYSFVFANSAMTAKLPVYLKCEPQADGSAVIDATTPIVQTLPSTEDGKIYIFLGVAISATVFELYEQHPVYEYKNGHIRQYQEGDSASLVELSAATTAINATLTTVSGAAHTKISNLSGATTGMNATLTAHTADTTVHITSAERTRWQNAWTSGVSAYTKVEALSAATTAHTGNGNIHVTSAQKTTWTNQGNSGASAYTAVTALSAATTGINNTLTAHTANTTVHITSSERTNWGAAYTNRITGASISSAATNNATISSNKLSISAATVPSYSSAENGKFLMVSGGTLVWTTPITVYTGTGNPDNQQGDNGDIYLQTS